jgi:hypothetical protein
MLALDFTKFDAWSVRMTDMRYRPDQLPSGVLSGVPSLRCGARPGNGMSKDMGAVERQFPEDLIFRAGFDPL